jgi:hypothetical protein
MRRLLRWYGAGPLHLLSLVACFALAGYAAAQLVPSRPLGVAVWFLGAVIGHDLLLVPLYSLADRSAVAVFRHRDPGLPTVAWINYVRVPAALSGLLLLLWFPLILRLTTAYHASTTLSPNPYLWHWLAVTGALFLLSAVAFAVRLRRTQEHVHPAEEEGQPRPAEGEGTQGGQGTHGDGTSRDPDPADDGPRDDGPRDDGPRDDGPRDDGPRDDGPRDDGPRDDGPRDDGPRDDGPRDDGLPGPGEKTPPAILEGGPTEISGKIAPATAATVPETAESVEPAPQQTATADPGACGRACDQPEDDATFQR